MSLPAGTVTFFFSDIEGSTRLLHRLGDQYDTLLTDQRRILRDAFERWGGQEIDTQGDSFFACFQKASDAVAAAVDIQQTIADHSWPEGVEVHLRMGLHTGEPRVAEEGYVGIDVHRAARVGNLGHGGQVLLSETTATLVRVELPGGVSLKALGEHELKDFDQPEPISQLIIPGLPAEFPALRSPGVRPVHLPAQSTPFIGRKPELDALSELICDPEVRLVTIFGAGGMGKTRLALAAGEKLAASLEENGQQEEMFVEGIFFVPLASLESSSQLESAIASAVGFKFYEGVEPRRQLLDYFREKNLLLILDNFEHLLDGAGLVAEILEYARQVKVLVTSRERLSMTAETIYSLGGMAFPEDGFEEGESPEMFEDKYSALKLFTRTAARVNPELQFTPRYLNSIVEICRLVDGMPLAIELAAAWTEVLSPPKIAEQIREKLDFLSADRRDLPERHQSIRAVFDSTWEMLSEQQREVFANLSVFQGGFTAEAAGAVAGASLKDLRQLANKALIQPSGDDRYGVHELLRQYAGERLKSDPDQYDQIRDRHSSFFAEFLHENEPDILGGDQELALLDIDNIRSGLSWAIEQKSIADIRKQMFSLHHIYQNQLWNQEAIALFEKIAKSTEANSSNPEEKVVHALALAMQGHLLPWTGQEGADALQAAVQQLSALDARRELAWAQKVRAKFDASLDYDQAKVLLEESARGFEQLGDTWGLIGTHCYWGDVALFWGDLDSAEDHYQGVLSLNKTLNDPLYLGYHYAGMAFVAVGRRDFDAAIDFFEKSGVAGSAGGSNKVWQADMWYRTGWVALLKGDLQNARRWKQQGLELYRIVGNAEGVAYSKQSLGGIATLMGDYSFAERNLLEAKRAFDSLNNEVDSAYVIGNMGQLALAKGELATARAHFVEALKLGRTYEHQLLCQQTLDDVAPLFQRLGRVERAIELSSYARTAPRAHVWSGIFAERRLDELREEVPQEVFDAACEHGETLELWSTVDAVVEELKTMDLSD